MKQVVTASPNSLDPYTGTWGALQSAHLIRRTMFGATAAEIATLTKQTMSQAVDTLLADGSPETSMPLIWYHYDINGSTQGDSWVPLDYDTTNDFNRNESLAAWWINLMLSQSLSIREKMTLFWHNHFACGVTAVSDARYMYKQNAMLRANALGNFKSLAKSITFDPAILRYLTGNKNIRTAPNENYGRELQELFTIGKSDEVSAGDYMTYTEADVKAAAHVLTGWSDDQKSVGYVFKTADHDPSDKQFSARYGSTVIKGRADQAGAEAEIDDLLTMIFSEDATARYICRKLYRFFVDYVIDDSIEQNIIGPLANCLKTNNFEIKPVLTLLLKSSHFYDPGFAGCIIKTPLDLLIGSIRVLGVVMPANEGLITQYYGWIALRLTGANLQMKLLEPPNVAGWPAYYQSPEYHEIWINAATLDARIQFLDQILTNTYSAAVTNYYKTSLDPTQFAALSSDASNPNTLISDWANLLFPNPLTSDQLKTLHDTLLPGLPDYEWTNEWNAFIGSPGDATKQQAVTDKLTQLLKYMVEMAEYQVM